MIFTDKIMNRFEEYRYHLIDHLTSVTAKHWDKSMRILASKALYTLVPLDPHYFIEKALLYLASKKLLFFSSCSCIDSLILDTQCNEH